MILCEPGIDDSCANCINFLILKLWILKKNVDTSSSESTQLLLHLVIDDYFRMNAFRAR